MSVPIMTILAAVDGSKQADPVVSVGADLARITSTR